MTPPSRDHSPARPADQEVGPQLRAIRESRGISLRQVAKSIGISPSALSQIETNRSKPSVSTLYALVSELGVSLDELFVSGNGAPGGAVAQRGRPAAGTRPVPRGAGHLREDERKRISLETGVVWERLTPTAEPDVDFLHVIYEVGGASSAGDTFVRHSGREYGLLLEGQLRVTVGFDEHDLSPGDSIAFDSSVPHRLENIGTTPARAVWFVHGRYGSDARRSGLVDA